MFHFDQYARQRTTTYTSDYVSNVTAALSAVSTERQLVETLNRPTHAGDLTDRRKLKILRGRIPTVLILCLVFI
jgi:hypothetical protein